MREKRTKSIAMFSFLVSLLFSSVLMSATFSQSGGLTSREYQVVALVNGSEAYNYDLEIEEIGSNHTLSNYSFRSGGSTGANETAQYIMKKFQSLGLETHNESFHFTNWDLPTKPTLLTDDDNNPATTADQVIMYSFQSTHYSFPTPQGGVFRDLVILSLPPAANIGEIGLRPINTTAWNAINTSGKILLIGREVTWSSSWHLAYRNKLAAQPPAAIILTWWYDWMSFTPMMYSSAGGRPLSSYGPYYWNLQIPVGGVDYGEGLWIRNSETTMNVSANFKIESVVSSGPHYNVIGKMTGYEQPNKYVIVSGHYDTVTTPGFADNGAGTAGVIELARVLTDAVKNGLYHPKYSILFIAFTSEELGLVGSIYYIEQHKAEMPDIVSVINLDCIGSDDFYVSQTNPAASGLDLDQLVLQAATDLGIPAGVTGTGGSDQEPFRDPAWANAALQSWWGINPGISDAAPVAASSILESEPLLYDDQWSMGTPGWIHTANDNSTSTQTLNWVEITDLENHIKIATLSIMRVSPSVSVHDVAVANVIGSKTIVGQGYPMKINVTVRNLGDFTENFNMTLYANSTAIGEQSIVLANQTLTQLTFIWHTTGFAKGSYGISAATTPISGDIDTTNNALGDGLVKVVTPGDVNADGVVNIVDISGMSAHWTGPPSGPLDFNPDFDINNDGAIDILEISIISAYWTGPPKGPIAP